MYFYKTIIKAKTGSLGTKAAHVFVYYSSCNFPFQYSLLQKRLDVTLSGEKGERQQANHIGSEAAYSLWHFSKLFSI